MQNNTFSTLFVGQNLIKLPSVDSTNNYLKMLVSKSEPLPEGTVIMADDQFAGRGQQNATWLSQPGLNLTFSLYLQPTFLKIADQFMLNMMVCNALRFALARVLGEDINCKWPNDLYYRGKKLGGILIENILAGSTYKAAIVGIGINVNQLIFNGPLADRATSIIQILQQDVNLIKLLAEICSQIESGYLKLRSNSYPDLRERYLEGLYQFNEMATYKKGNDTFQARITDVSRQGQLVVERDGETLYYNFKEIEFLNPT